MSTSIALVTCADVSSERRMCSAIPRRIAVIGSTTRRLGPRRRARLRPAGAGCGATAARGRSGGAGGAAAAAAAGSAGGAGAAGAGAAAGAAALRRPWPRLDEGEDVLLRHAAAAPGALDGAGSTPCSAAIRATTGETNVLPLPAARRPAGAAGGSAPARRRGGAGAARGAACRGAGGSRRPRRRPRPARRRRGALGRRPLGSGGCASAPFGRDHRELRADLDRLALRDEDLLDDALAGARHLGVDLVGRDLEQGSSASIVSPSCFSHFVIVPSETETPICGMTTSTAVPVHVASSASVHSVLGELAESPATTSSTCGMNAFSSGGENGTGVSGAAIRFTGASRSSNASSAIVAAISAPKPPVRVSSCRTSTFDVLRDALEHGLLVPRDQRAQVDDLDRDVLRLRARFAASSAV